MNGPEVRSFEGMRLPIVGETEDWSTEVIRRTYGWMNAYTDAPAWLTVALSGKSFALVPVGHRWALKVYTTVLLFKDKAGWPYLHELVRYGHLLDRESEMLDGVITEMDTADRIANGVTTRVRTQTLRNHIQRAINRVLKSVDEQDQMSATVLRMLYDPKHLTFASHTDWITSLDEIYCDASIVYVAPYWEISIPGHQDIKMRDSTNMRRLAKVLTCHNLACPTGLIYDETLAQSLTRPGHNDYFSSLYNYQRVFCCDPTNGPLEEAVLAAKFKVQRRGKSFLAKDRVTTESILHKKYGVPTGRLSLEWPESLVAVRNLVEQQRARRFMMTNTATDGVEEVVDTLNKGIVFVGAYRSGINRIGQATLAHAEAVRKSIYRAIREMEEMAAYVCKYGGKHKPFLRMSQFFDKHIKCGDHVIHYRGEYRFRVEGVPQVPDPLGLALDCERYTRSREGKVRSTLTMGDRRIIYSVMNGKLVQPTT